MRNTQNYRLANLARKELKLQTLRQDILTCDSENALDMILEASSPATLVQSFPDQDLYYLMHKIGVHDFLPALSLATSKQWEYILDVEVWDDDRLNTDLMTQVFSTLFKADPQRMLRWIIKEKPDFFEFYLFKNMQVVIREHDELPPSDFDDYVTLDDKFYFRFPDRPDPGQNAADPMGETEETPEDSANGDAGELIETMLKVLAGMDLSVFHGLLLETCGVLPAETEEEQFRLKNLRLAEKGFLPAHEAVGIYQPSPLAGLRKRPQNPAGESYDPDIPLPPQFFSQFIKGDDLFVKSLSRLEPELLLTLQPEMAALINKVISADKIKIRDRDTIEKTIKKTTAFLSLGLEVILEKAPGIEQAAQTISTYFLEDIFRAGSRAGIRLKTRAANWYEKSFIKKSLLPLSFLGETYLGVIGGLLLDRPMFFANYTEKELYRHFKSLNDIQETGKILDQVIELDRILGQIPLNISSFTQGVLTYKSLLLTLWAKNRIGLDQNSLAPINKSEFIPFFTALFSGKRPGKIDKLKADDFLLWAGETTGASTDIAPPFKALLADLIEEIQEEYGKVSPENIDPRFIHHFLLAPEEAMDPAAGFDMNIDKQ